jgi:phosphomannomutase
VAAIDPSVFKSYDIRGTYPNQLDERFAYLLGRSLPAVFGAQRVAVGHDARLSSPSLYAALCAGLRDAGAQVAGIGLCATELVYFVMGSIGTSGPSSAPASAARTGSEGLDLGVMITASHNPPEYNGFKVVKAGGEPISAASGLGGICEHMEATSAGVPHGCAAPDKALFVEDDYLDFALTLVGMPEVKGLRIAVDAGSGVAGLLWRGLSLRLGFEPVRLNFEPDGRFPAHHPDPSRRENLDQLVAVVEEEGLDLGFAYDGDADRVVVVLQGGHVVDGSEMIVCIASRLLQRDASLPLGVGQTSSRKALDYFRKRGVEIVMLPVGHAKIKAFMRSNPQIAFAGEDAGHCYYRDFFRCDSSLITTLHLLHLAASAALVNLVRSLPGPWLRPEKEPTFGFSRQSRALEVCRQVALVMLERHPEPLEVTCEKHGRILRNCSAGDVEQCDGVRVDYAAWWFCVRPSGTEPIARLAIEARTPELLGKMTDIFTSLFRAFE